MATGDFVISSKTIISTAYGDVFRFIEQACGDYQVYI